MTIQGTQVLMYTKNILFLCFSDFSIFFFYEKHNSNYVLILIHDYVFELSFLTTLDK